MSSNMYHLTQVQVFTEVLPSGRWSKTYMLPGTTLMSVPGHDSAGNIAPWNSVRLFRVWAAPMFYDLALGDTSPNEGGDGPGYNHWSGWVYLPVDAVQEGAWVAK